MQIQNRYFKAAIAVLDWDMPEDVYPEAVNAQACHLAGSDDNWSDDVWRCDLNDVGPYNIRRSVH